MLEVVRRFNKSIALGITDQGASILIHKVGDNGPWRDVMVSHTSRKTISAVEKLTARRYYMQSEPQGAPLYRRDTLMLICEKENEMPWCRLRDMFNLFTAPEQGGGTLTGPTSKPDGN
jgi:hypothetical protein